MSENIDLAEITIGRRTTDARFARSFSQDRPAVWAALTEPARLATWLAPGAIELRDGGKVKLDFADSGTVIDSFVSAIDPGFLLEYSWSGPGEPRRPVRWEVSDANGGSSLVLTLQVPKEEDAARACAGWSAHLEMLAATLEGVAIKFPFDHFKTARDLYRAKLAS